MGKVCDTCGAEFRGFGTTCPECRRGNKPEAHSSTPGAADINETKCHACGKTVYAMERLVIEGLLFHKDGCWKCAQCGMKLSIGKFGRAADGQFYCSTHFKELFRRKGKYDFKADGTPPKASVASSAGPASDAPRVSAEAEIPDERRRSGSRSGSRKASQTNSPDGAPDVDGGGGGGTKRRSSSGEGGSPGGSQEGGSRPGSRRVSGEGAEVVQESSPRRSSRKSAGGDGASPRSSKRRSGSGSQRNSAVNAGGGD